MSKERLEHWAKKDPDLMKDIMAGIFLEPGVRQVFDLASRHVVALMTDPESSKRLNCRLLLELLPNFMEEDNPSTDNIREMAAIFLVMSAADKDP